MSGASAHRPVRPRRSALFMPGSNSRALAKARTLPADVIIMDLEDAVAPGAKSDARDRVASALAEGGYGARERVVRVNALDTEWGATDLAAAARMQADALLIPKVETPQTILETLEHLRQSNPDHRLALWVMIETPSGVLAARDLCAAHASVECAVLGTSDLASTLRVAHSAQRTGLLGALAHCVLAARAAGLDILDGVQLDLADPDALRAVCEQGRALGFDGKTLIHPSQIATANAVFAPAADAIAAASRVLDAWDQALAEGRGLAVVDGRLVEHLHAQDARRLLALARAINERETA